jgi:hypothetical protein
MNQTPINHYAVVVVVLLFEAIFYGLLYGGYRLVKYLLRVYHYRIEKIIIAPSNDADDNFI